MTRASLVPIIALALSAAIASSAFCQSAPSPAGATAETIQQVCLPLLKGADLKTTARAAGFNLSDGDWVLSMGQAANVVLQPPDSSNPHACGATITSPSSVVPSLRQAVDAWAREQKPALARVKFAEPVAGSSDGWVSSLWIARTPGGVESVVLSQQQPADATAAGQSNLIVSLGPQ